MRGFRWFGRRGGDEYFVWCMWCKFDVGGVNARSVQLFAEPAVGVIVEVDVC